MEVEWKAAVGEDFPTDDVNEHVVFTSYFERGFNLLPRSSVLLQAGAGTSRSQLPIIVVSTFINFSEAYLGISPHFLLWRHLFCVKNTGKRSGLVGVVIFCLRSGLKSEWIDTDLPDNNAGWRSEWFYIAGQLPGLPRHFGHKPVKISEWDLGLSSREADDLKKVLELVKDLKNQGVTGGSVARSFCRRLIQPIKDRVHITYEYWGQSDPTREVNRKVAKEEMVARGKVKIKKCPNAHSLKRPANPMSSRTCFRLFRSLLLIYVV
jgi:hypothetical protein